MSERTAAPGAAPGSVVEQTPPAGQQLEPRGAVTVALARELPKVPSVLGRTLAEATALLAQAGYKVQQGEPIADAHVAKGSVVGQLPEADKLQDTDAPIVVRLSSGPAEIELPRLLGQNIEKVKAQAKEAGYTLKIVWTAVGETDEYVAESESGARYEAQAGRRRNGYGQSLSRAPCRKR